MGVLNGCWLFSNSTSAHILWNSSWFSRQRFRNSPLNCLAWEEFLRTTNAGISERVPVFILHHLLPVAVAQGLRWGRCGDAATLNLIIKVHEKITAKKNKTKLYWISPKNYLHKQISLCKSTSKKKKGWNNQVLKILDFLISCNNNLIHPEQDVLCFAS